MGYLKLRLEDEGDGSGELFVQFEQNGFSGHGSAWFNLKLLGEKAMEFKKYPLQNDRSAYISGGFWEESYPAKLKEELLHISAYPINQRGGVAIYVKVANRPFGSERESEPLSIAAAEIVTSYPRLEVFSNDLKNLLDGILDEVVLSTGRE
ncbi:hypothetical protein [Solimicrobium silvestre]|uniref:Uncharacterized protein n=1 Tax=Solimicrobium silvestre TaxID=2099400 RepID=A0A2S9GYC4_9BURK|nr:hypothetical protein [Solimicrobium silvestre]PRC92727.1 hypothetical protein S2091_2457 [Solimicrobium silvestre]